MSLTDDLTGELELAEDAGQFLTFVLDGEEYGIQILKVQEIKGLPSITPIPHTPSFVKGVMNLRGTVVPVVDMREKFALPRRDYDQFTVTVVVTVGSRVVGLIVDAVSDVLSIDEAEIAPTPELGGGIDTSFMTGLAKAGEKLVLLLDIDKVVSEETLAALGAAA